MKKILLLIATLFLLTGCDATYTVEFKNGKWSDDTRIYEAKQAFINRAKTDVGKNQIVNALYQFGQTNPEIAKHKFYSTDTVAGYQYHNNFSITKDLNGWPSLVNACYQYFDIYESKDHELTIKTPAKFTCFDKYSELENVTILFKTNHKVIQSNADQVDGDTYTWNLNRTDTVKPLYLKISLQDKEEEPQKKSFPPILWIILGLLLLAGLIYWLVKRKKENDDF